MVLLAGCNIARKYFQMETSRVRIQQLQGTQTPLIHYVSYIPVQPQLLRQDRVRGSSSHLWKCWSNLKPPIASPAANQNSFTCRVTTLLRSLKD